jgi:hypothetical protein
LQGVEDAAQKLPPDDGEVMLARLQLARAFLGDKDPLKHFLRWRLPGELDESGFEKG